MTKSFRDRSPYAVGAVSMAIIAVLVGIAFLAGVRHAFERTYPMRGVFSDAAGIRAGDDVRVAGVKAGRVTGVKADRRAGNVIVTWVVNQGVELGPGTRAEIALATLLGTKYLRLTGPVRRPFMEDTPEPRRVVPLERTQTPFDVFELTKVATRSIEATDTARLNRLIGQLADVTEGKHDQIAQLVDGIARVSEAVNQRDTKLRELLDRADRVTATLAEKDETLAALVDQSEAVLDLIARRRVDVSEGIRGAATAFESLAAIVAVRKGEVDSILDTLHPTAALLERRQGDIDRTLAWLGQGALGLSRGPGHGPWADIYVRSLGPDLVALIEQSRGAGP